MPMRDSLVITSETTIESLLRNRPYTAEVLIAHATLCVGCWMSSFHTIAEVAALYHIELEQLLHELRDVMVQKGEIDADIDTLDN